MALNDDAKREIHNYLLKGLLLFGIANIVVIVVGYWNVVFKLPKEVSTEAIQHIQSELVDDFAALRSQIVDVSGKALIDGGRAIEKAEKIAKDLEGMEDQLQALKKAIKSFSAEDSANIMTAATALRDNPRIISRVSESERKLRGIENIVNEFKRPAYKILGIIRIKNGKVISKSEGISYDSLTGEVTFPNPEKFTCVPVLSDISGRGYITVTHFLGDINDKGSFEVLSTALDTSDRTYPPSSFTAIVIGFRRGT